MILAPGKAILCGEYAVLHGAPAIVVAVDRCVRARVETVRQNDAPSPFVAAAIRRTRATLGDAPEVQLDIDSSALYAGARKLGLGSSAAVTVAAVGATLHAAGQSLPLTMADRRRIFDLAEAAHAEAQGTRGSGIDVAAAVWGGALRFVRANGRAEVTPVTLPAALQLTFVDTGTSASTAALLERVKALAESNPGRHDAALRPLTAYAHAFADAVRDGEVERIVDAADAYGEAMAWLGDAAEVAIVTATHRRLAEIARRHRGAAKPSGAGGGDLNVLFTVGDEATRSLRAELAAADLAPLPLGAPAPGLRLENA